MPTRSEEGMAEKPHILFSTTDGAEWSISCSGHCHNPG